MLRSRQTPVIHENDQKGMASHMKEGYPWIICSTVVPSEIETRQLSEEDAAFEAQAREQWLDDGGMQDLLPDRKNLDNEDVLKQLHLWKLQVRVPIGKSKPVFAKHTNDVARALARVLKREGKRSIPSSVFQRKGLLMQTDQLTVLPLKETQAIGENEPAETIVVAQGAAPDERVPSATGSEESATETSGASPRRQRQYSLPSWPTSQPGPEITAPSSGQRRVRTRTDQVRYDFYDQERGLPGPPPPGPANQARKS